MINALTIDVEEWYHANLLRMPESQWASCPSRVVENTRKILQILKRHQVQATFFVLGDIAKRSPSLIQEIMESGHEIGSHGYRHRLVSQMTDQSFREDLLASKQIIEQITGMPIRYFRAPSWSLSPDRKNVFHSLVEAGITCDSSMQPFRTPLSGSSGIPIEPYYPIIDDKRLPLLEFPPTILKWQKISIPFAGGFYLRAMPYPVIAAALRQVNRTRPGMVYLHPWELDRKREVNFKRMGFSVPWYVRWEHEYHTETSQPKLEKLLNEFSFSSLGKVISEHHFPALSI